MPLTHIKINKCERSKLVFNGMRNSSNVLLNNDSNI